MKLSRRPWIIVLVVITLGVLAYWVIDPLDSDLGGPTGDAIAAEIGGECATERSTVDSDDATYDALPQRLSLPPARSSESRAKRAR